MSIKKTALCVTLAGLTPLQSCDPATITIVCTIVTAVAAATTIIVFLERDQLVIEIDGKTETRHLTPRQVRDITAACAATVTFADGSSGTYKLTRR